MADIVARKSDGSLAANKVQEPTGRLGTQQQTALELMVTGKSITQTAREAGVARSTIYEWLRHDPVFQAAYNQWHDQLEEGCRSRLLTLTDKATDAIEKALENGDARAALQLLKGMGMIRHKIVGPTDAEEIAARTEIEKEKKRIAMKRDKGGLIMEDLLAEGGM
jgi:transposase-like protein